MATTVQSRKAKGRVAQQQVAKAILAKFPELTERDVMSVPIGTQGDDILLSEAAVKKFPFSVEVKCQETLNIWAAIKQVEVRATQKPLVAFKRNRTEMYCVLKLSDLLELL
jgi:hypothetical protein